jgi:hypothetical protein
MSEREDGVQRPGTERVGRPAVRLNLGACLTLCDRRLFCHWRWGRAATCPLEVGPAARTCRLLRSKGHSGTVLYRVTARLPWDDLDAQACAEDGMPDWNSLIVVGPIRRRGEHGQVTLEWKVTVYCPPAVTPRPRSADRPGERDTRDDAATPTLRRDG